MNGASRLRRATRLRASDESTRFAGEQEFAELTSKLSNFSSRVFFFASFSARNSPRPTHAREMSLLLRSRANKFIPYGILSVIHGRVRGVYWQTISSFHRIPTLFGPTPAIHSPFLSLLTARAEASSLNLKRSAYRIRRYVRCNDGGS